MTSTFAGADYYLYTCTGCDTRTLLGNTGGPLNECGCDRAVEQILATPLDARVPYPVTDITKKEAA